jgi:replicative DNA helicase
MEIDHFGRSENRVQEVTQMSRALKALARQINKPVVVLSQLSRHIERREFESRAPMLSDLRESGAIEQDADKIIFLQRVRDAQKIVDNHFEHMGQMYYVPDEDEIERAVPVWLYISKNRNGPTGKMLLGFNRQCIKFVSYDPRTSQTERYS